MRKLVYFIGIIFFCIFIYLVYSGIFSSATLVGPKKLGPYKIAYEEHTGDYSKVRNVIQKVYTALSKEKITPQVAFGVFYDNPANIKKSKLHSIGGFILTEISSKQVAGIKKTIKYKILPPKEYIVAEFPMRTKISSFLGPAKAYPAIREYMDKKKLTFASAMEIYDMKNKKLRYCLSVKKNNAN